MLKASINLGRINSSIVVKFNLILKDEGVKNPSHMLVNKFHISGADYITFNPHPWISIDISPRKPGSGYDRNNTLSLTRPYVYKMCKFLREALNQLKTESLFYYDRDGNLHLNKEVSKDHWCRMPVKDRNIAAAPVVVQEENSPGYEGIAIMIQNVSNYATMTIDEVEALIHLLATTDMNQMAMQTITAAAAFKDVGVEKIVKPQPAPETEPEVIDKRLHIEEPTAVPDLK